MQVKDRNPMMKNRLHNLFPFVAALLLGVLLSFAFAPYEVFPLAILAPAGLIALWLNASPKRAFCLGFSFGLGLFGVGVYWVFISIHTIGEVPASLSGIITAFFIAALALFPATVGYLSNRYFSRPSTAKILCVFPAFWVFSEWVRSWLCTGFPWLFLGYSQTNSPLKGIAPLLGVYGVSLAVIVSSALIVNASLAYKQKAFQSLYRSLFALITLWVASGLVTLIPWTQAEGKTIPVALVQGNIPQEIKWSPEHLKLSFERYVALTDPLWGKAKLIIWPEAAIPVPLQNTQRFINDLDDKAKESGTTLMLGIPIQTTDARGYYNAIVTVGDDQKVYLKRRLVPFGEYTPFSRFFARAFSFMDIPMSDMVPGKPRQDLLMVGGMKILPSICYEIGFPDLIRAYDPSIGFLLTLTNDAWFGKSNAQAQHLQMAAMRALEFGRPVLFVSNDGITAIIGPDGKIEAQAPPHQTFVLTSTVQPMFGITPWMRNGTDPVLFTLLFLIGIAIRANRKVASTKTVTVTETAS